MAQVDFFILYELRGEIEVSIATYLIKFVSEFEAQRLEAVKEITNAGTIRKVSLANNVAISLSRTCKGQKKETATFEGLKSKFTLRGRKDKEKEKERSHRRSKSTDVKKKEESPRIK